MTFDDADKKQRLDSAAERVIDLADKIFSNYGSSEDIAELESLLLATPELRKIYLRYVMIHSQLAVSTSGLSGDVLIANKTKAPASIDKKTTLGRLLAIASAISPYREVRDYNRRMIGSFVEIFVKTSVII